MRTLIQEEMELTEQIETYLSSIRNYNSKSQMKEKIRKNLKNIGFKILPDKVKNIRTLNLVKDNSSFQIVIVQSSYQEKSYNAWYTLKPEVENIVDFVIFIYSDKSGNDSFFAVPKGTLKILLQRISKMPDGRTNIKLKADHINAVEIQARMDLSNGINNFNLLLSDIE